MPPATHCCNWPPLCCAALLRQLLPAPVLVHVMQEDPGGGGQEAQRWFVDVFGGGRVLDRSAHGQRGTFPARSLPRLLACLPAAASPGLPPFCPPVTRPCCETQIRILAVPARPGPAWGPVWAGGAGMWEGPALGPVDAPRRRGAWALLPPAQQECSQVAPACCLQAMTPAQCWMRMCRNLLHLHRCLLLSTASCCVPVPV